MRSLVIAVIVLGCGRIDFGGVGDDGAPSDGAPQVSLELLAGDIGGRGNVDGTGAAARFDSPSGLAVDSAGNVYVADRNNETIRKITPGGVATTLAGAAGMSGSADGKGAAARFASPVGVAVDRAGNVYVADSVPNQTIRKITPDGVVTTLAGTAGVSGSADGLGPAARFASPVGVAVDGAGNVYVADGTPNKTIRKITPDGRVTTLAGTAGVAGSADGIGPAARFNNPSSVAVDSAGNVYVADYDGGNLRKITPAGVVSTLAAGGAFPAGVAVDGAGNIYFSVYFFIQKFSPAGMMTTVGGIYGDGSADGTSATASFRRPSGIAVDGSGNVYVADTGNDTIRKISLAGMVTTLAGTASAFGGDDGTGGAARFFFPTGVAADGAGNVYVADQLNSIIRKVAAGGVVTTLAGAAGMYGSSDGTAFLARFGDPDGVAVDSAGNIYVADQANDTIRKVTSDRVVTTLAGSTVTRGSADGQGPDARFDSPAGVATDSADNVYVADQANDTIRKITAGGVVTTLAGAAGVPGSADGIGPTARFNSPSGVAVDSAGNVYVADRNNETIRKITPDGVVTTLAGTAGASGSADGTGPEARFASPTGVAIDSADNVYVADALNRTIRQITTTGVVTTVAGIPGAGGIRLGATPRFALPKSLTIVGDSIVIADVNAILLLRHGVR